MIIKTTAVESVNMYVIEFCMGGLNGTTVL